MNAIMKITENTLPPILPPLATPLPPIPPINLHSTAMMKKRGLLHKQKLHNYTPINYRDSVFKILKRCCNNTISLRIMSDVVPKNYYYYDEMKTILLVVKIHVLSISFIA
jgi:hypothetical protein